MVQWFVCLSVAMTTSQGNGYGTQSIRRDVNAPHIGRQKPAGKDWQPSCETYVTSHKKAFDLVVSGYCVMYKQRAQ